MMDDDDSHLNDSRPRLVPRLLRAWTWTWISHPDEWTWIVDPSAVMSRRRRQATESSATSAAFDTVTTATARRRPKHRRQQQTYHRGGDTRDTNDDRAVRSAHQQGVHEAEAIVVRTFCETLYHNPSATLDQAILHFEQAPLDQTLDVFARIRGRTADGYRETYRELWWRAWNRVFFQ